MLSIWGASSVLIQDCRPVSNTKLSREHRRGESCAVEELVQSPDKTKGFILQFTAQGTFCFVIAFQITSMASGAWDRLSLQSQR